ncbi:TetR/AcrR family transcriptional regulator [Sporomusa aerivorans]|uniref:TetR/AcrR family transcriptional regulator n=1 Tax=Sporomusa aerivorans TaxID=204936 RepID=UPI00352A3FE3
MENDTRSKLLEIATPLFATKGFTAVSIRELTDAAQINVSAISYHFNGKEGLYQAVLAEQLAPILQALQAAKSNAALSPIERLTFYANQIARIHAQRPFLARFMISEVTNPTNYGGPIIEAHLSQVYEFMKDTLQEGITQGNFRADLNLNYAAISLAGILNFYFITKPLIQKFIPLKPEANTEYVDHAFHVYLHGIMNHSPSKKLSQP